MKKSFYTLLFLLPFGVQAQMNQNTDPAAGTNASLYLCDSNAVTYDNVVGNGVTWDYSTILGLDTDADGAPDMRGLSVENINPTTDDSLFVGATKKYIVGNQVTTYYSTSLTERISQGFKFTEPSLGDVFTFWDTIPQLLNTYPFDFGSTSTAPMSGRIFSNNATASIDTFAIGNSYASIDGIGTLKLSVADYPNTFRYHFRDTINSYVDIDVNGFILNAPVALYRDVYEYYNYAISPLPIFVIFSVNNSIFLQPNTVVLSRDLPQDIIGIDEIAESSIQLYPNPGSSTYHTLFPEGSVAYVTDVQGNKILDIKGSSFTMEDKPAGMYFLVVDANGRKSTKKFQKL